MAGCRGQGERKESKPLRPLSRWGDWENSSTICRNGGARRRSKFKEEKFNWGNIEFEMLGASSVL